MLPLCRLQLLSRPRIFTAFNVHQVPLVCTQLMGLPHAGSCAGPLRVLYALTRGRKPRNHFEENVLQRGETNLRLTERGGRSEALMEHCYALEHVRGKHDGDAACSACRKKEKHTLGIRLNNLR
eukprot:1145582-Pelagomonas_calceolata.AAC.3